MYKEILKLKFIPVKNCFLHLSAITHSKLSGTSIRGIHLSYGGNDFYFSAADSPNLSVENGEIGISATYAKYLHLGENECVTISTFDNVGSVTKICARPFTSDDLEILQESREEVELIVLRQLRVVWPKQVFPIWITPSLTVTFAIDSLLPDLKFGRLEEYSEIDLHNVNPYKHSNSPVLPTSRKPSKHTGNEEVFRCFPLEIPFESSAALKELLAQPYSVFLNKANCPKWLISLVEIDQPSIWKFNRIEFGKDGMEAQQNQDGHGGSAKKFHEIVVSVYLSDNLNGRDIGKLQSLFISSTIRKFLNLEPGSKISLKYLDHEGSNGIVGLLVTPLFDEDYGTSKQIESDLREQLYNIIVNCGKVLINSNAPFLLKNHGYIILTIRPLNIQWGLLTLNELLNLSVSCNPIKSDNLIFDSSPDAIPEKVKNIVLSSEQLLSQGFDALDMSLGLNSGPQLNFSEKFMDNIILIGKRGSGKSFLASKLLEKICSPPYYVHGQKIDCTSLKGKRIDTVNKILIESLNRCKELEPSVLVLDNISAIASVPKQDQEKSEASFHITRVSHKVAELIELYQMNNLILVIGTADSFDSINPKLISTRGKSTFTTKLTIPELSKTDRCEIIYHMICEKAPGSEKLISKLDFDSYATRTDGYVIKDLIQFIFKALFEAWQRKALIGGPLTIITSDLETAIGASTPFSLQGLNVNKGSKITFADIGGLQDAKEKLTKIILWPIEFPEIIGQCPLKQQNSALLYGVPGTGKTLLANAVAGESGLNFISIKGPELMSKYIGESEEAVRRLFEKAQAAKPCLLFFDEFDSLAPRRGKDQTGVTDRVVNQLLTALDGVESLTGVWVIAATSRPDLIDPALLRPGRIGTSVFCDLPSKSDRVEILQHLCANVCLADDVILDEIAGRTEMYTGADLKGLISTAQIKLLDNLVELSSNEEKGLLKNYMSQNIQDSLIVTRDGILQALKETTPCLNVKELLKYEMLYNEFTSGKNPDVSTQKITLA